MANLYRRGPIYIFRRKVPLWAVLQVGCRTIRINTGCRERPAALRMAARLTVASDTALAALAQAAERQPPLDGHAVLMAALLQVVEGMPAPLPAAPGPDVPGPATDPTPLPSSGQAVRTGAPPPAADSVPSAPATGRTTAPARSARRDRLAALDVTRDMPLSQAFPRYRAAAQAQWDDKTRGQAAEAETVLLSLAGDIPLRALDRPFAARLIGRARHLPRLRGRSAYTGMTPAAALDAALGLQQLLATAPTPSAAGIRDRLPAYDPARHTATPAQLAGPIGAKTMNRYLTYWGGFHAWAILQTEDQPRPHAFAGLARSKQEVRAEATLGRRPWPDADLVALFRSPNWSGWHRHRHHPGPTVVQDWMYWGPLLAYFALLRLEEIAQIKVEDIQADHRGIALIAVTATGSRAADRLRRQRRAADRRVKSPNAVRDVPVHPLLQQIGFLDYVARQRAAGDIWLFPELATGSDLPTGWRRSGDGVTARAHKGERLSDWFTRYRRHVGLFQHGMDLHALRTTANTALINAGISPDFADYLMGHQVNRLTTTAYFGGFDSERLFDALSRLALPEPVAFPASQGAARLSDARTDPP